jgi:hypothetical protein
VWGGKKNVKFAEHGLEPNEFSGSGSKGAVFGFSAGAGDCPLFAGRPRDEIGTKKNTKASSGFSVVGAAGPIRVGVGLEGVG